MKVDPGAPMAPRPVRPARAGERSGDGSFAAHIGGGAARPTGGSGPIARLGAALALDAFADAGERRRRATRRGGRLLDLLDELRLALTVGRLPAGMLPDLAGAVAELREELDDPALESVLDEIDLRAQVELAKYERSA